MNFSTDEGQAKLSIGLSILAIALMIAAFLRIVPHSLALTTLALDFLFQLWRFKKRPKQL